jgi:hypothetical protein
MAPVLDLEVERDAGGMCMWARAGRGTERRGATRRRDGTARHIATRTVRRSAAASHRTVSLRCVVCALLYIDSVSESHTCGSVHAPRRRSASRPLVRFRYICAGRVSNVLIEVRFLHVHVHVGSRPFADPDAHRTWHRTRRGTPVTPGASHGSPHAQLHSLKSHARHPTVAAGR